MTYIERASRTRIIMRTVLDLLAKGIALIAVALFFNFILLNWLSGCGERFPTADGGYIQGECITPVTLWNDYRQSQRTGEGS